MLNTIPFAILIGIGLGFLAGLGVGGGSLLVVWLSFVLDFDPETVRIVNLMFFIASAGSVCLFRRKDANVPLKKIWPAIISGCAATAISSILVKSMEQMLIKKLFGGLLLITGIRELLYRPRNAR